MTVSEIARLEGVTPRQILRYVNEGYKGCRLPAVRLGKAFSIIPDDYKLWRQQCGFDTTPAPASLAAPAGSPEDPRPAPMSPEDTHPTYPPWPLCADPAGPVTNAPHEHSSNWPHPLAVEDHRRSELEKQRYGGSNDRED